MSERRSAGPALKLGVALVVFAVLLGTAEAVTRLAFPLEPAEATRLQAFRDYAVHRRHQLYDPHPFTGYRPRGWATRGRARPEGAAVRIACLGGSTTEGATAWPSGLAKLLSDGTGPPVQVTNWGVSGWTTAETLLNYLLVVQESAPDWVLVHHAANDVLPRVHPGYLTDYSHWRHPWAELELSGWERWLLGTSDLFARLRMEGVRTNIQARVGHALEDKTIAITGDLPHGTARAFERNLRTLVRFVHSSGARAAILTMPYNPASAFRTGPVFAANARGTLEHNDLARRVAVEEGAVLVDLAADFEAAPATARHFRDGVHLHPGGHALKARQVAEALKAELRD